MLKWMWLSAVIIGLDLYTKHLASTLLEYGMSVPVLPVFKFTLLHNHGAAFSFLADQGGWQRWFFAILAVVVSGILIRWLASLKKDTWLAIAIALVLGGALGNLHDRILLGYVVDFLHFHWEANHFPAFNIADSAITVGAIMMALDLFRSHQAEESERNQTGH